MHIKVPVSCDEIGIFRRPASIYVPVSANLKSSKPVVEETQEMMTLQSSDDSKTTKREELVLGYNKFHQRWMEQLVNTKLRKP